MRRVCYQVAASLDGFIAGPHGEYDWIPMDPDVDFAALFARFDTALLGRHTYEMMRASGQPLHPGFRTLVFSTTLRQEDHPDVTIVAANAARVISELKAQPGKDIWLFGGGSLFASLAAAGAVDTVEIAVCPVMLGAGIPLLPAPQRLNLQLTGHRLYPKSGITTLEYAVAR